MAHMKPINTSIFDFPTPLVKGCVYVDKTAQIYELVKPLADKEYVLLIDEHISAFADRRGESYDAAFAELLAWYDSYQFSPERGYIGRLLGRDFAIDAVMLYGKAHGRAAGGGGLHRRRTIDDVKCERAECPNKA